MLIGILDVSLNFIAFTLTRSNNFLYHVYKKKTYNIFLDLINLLYPATFYKGVFVSAHNVKKILKYNFVCMKYNRYNYKKKVLLGTENHTVVSNTRYCILIIQII